MLREGALSPPSVQCFCEGSSCNKISSLPLPLYSPQVKMEGRPEGFINWYIYIFEHSPIQLFFPWG